MIAVALAGAVLALTMAAVRYLDSSDIHIHDTYFTFGQP